MDGAADGAADGTALAPGDAAGAPAGGGGYVQPGLADVGAHAATLAATRPPPAIAADRRKPRRLRAASVASWVASSAEAGAGAGMVFMPPVCRRAPGVAPYIRPVFGGPAVTPAIRPARSRRPWRA